MILNVYATDETDLDFNWPGWRIAISFSTQLPAPIFEMFKDNRFHGGPIPRTIWMEWMFE